MNYFCKKFPWAMRPLLFILLFTGIWQIIIIIALLLENFWEFVDANVEVFNYVFKNEIE